MSNRPTFASTQAAKAYLVGKIVEQASYESAPLSDAEIKMLSYSVDSPSVADEVATEFEGDCSDYERRVAELLKRGYKKEKEKGESGEAGRFDEAVSLLAKEDHYLSVMAAQAALGRSDSKVWLQALMILGALILAGLAIVFWDR